MSAPIQALGPPAHLLKMISRSSSVVTGLSLHTNSTLLGGLASASGRSPIISSTTALVVAMVVVVVQPRGLDWCVCVCVQL